MSDTDGGLGWCIPPPNVSLTRLTSQACQGFAWGDNVKGTRSLRGGSHCYLTFPPSSFSCTPHLRFCSYVIPFLLPLHLFPSVDNYCTPNSVHGGWDSEHSHPSPWPPLCQGQNIGLSAPLPHFASLLLFSQPADLFSNPYFFVSCLVSRPQNSHPCSCRG